MIKGKRVQKKQTVEERLQILEKMVVRLSLQMNAILTAIHKPEEEAK